MLVRFALIVFPLCVFALQDRFSSPKEENNKLRDRYLSTVRMGLLGGLNHGAYTDPSRGATTDPRVRNECLAKDWTNGQILDNCIMKWDANERMLRVEDLYKKIREQGIPGDLMECGVWRGGITVYMAALLQAYDDNSRNVWVSDSFNGVPNAARQAETSDGVPQNEKLMDENQWGGSITERTPDGQFVEKNLLTVEQEYVIDNFKRFDLLSQNIKFIPGYFNETLPFVSRKGLKQLALLRVDGDLYSSTMDVLQNMYDMVSPGGFVIFDDWPLPQSKRAIEDFFLSRGVPLSMIKTDRMTPQDLTVAPDSKLNLCAYLQKPTGAVQQPADEADEYKRRQRELKRR